MIAREDQIKPFSSQLRFKPKWAIMLRGRVVEVPKWIRTDRLTPKEETTPLISQTKLMVEWSEAVVGNQHATKPSQVFNPALKFNRHLLATILNMGGFEAVSDYVPREGIDKGKDGEVGMDYEDGGGVIASVC